MFWGGAPVPPQTPWSGGGGAPTQSTACVLFLASSKSLVDREMHILEGQRSAGRGELIPLNVRGVEVAGLQALFLFVFLLPQRTPPAHPW